MLMLVIESMMRLQQSVHDCVIATFQYLPLAAFSGILFWVNVYSACATIMTVGFTHIL